MAAAQYIPFVAKNSCFKNLAGQRFGRLTAIEPMRKINPPRWGAHWRCVCDCGNTAVVSVGNLTTGGTESCGCLMIDRIRKASQTHGMSGTKTYIAWVEMRKRCNDPRNAAYRYYGARGITICPQWSSFEQFFADMGESPAGTQLDREDNSGNYEPLNCRWVTQKVNANNKRTNIWVEYQGQRMTLAALSELTGVEYLMLYKRLRAGWNVDRAVSTPCRIKRHALQ